MAAARVPPLWGHETAYAAGLRRGYGLLGLLVDLHEAQVVVRDLLRRSVALERAVEVALERVPPDRAADREPDVAVHRGARAQPAINLLVARPTPEHHADDLVATLAGTRLLGEHLAVRLLVHALDLPDVDLDAELLAVLDRAPHQLGPQLGVVAVGVAAHLLHLLVRRRHEELEQEQAAVVVEPVGETLEPLELALVHLAVGVVRVVADEDLGEVAVELLDVGAEVVAVVEVELVLTGLLYRHRELEAALLRLLGDALRCAELLVDEDARRVLVEPLVGGDLHALPDQVLGVGDLLGLLLRGIAFDPEHLLLERPAVVEREDEKLAVVAECHLGVPTSDLKSL